MHRNMRLFLPALAMLTLIWAGYGTATTIYVSGNVSGTWSADTVVVNGNATVPSYSTLTIQPHVKVFFQNYSGLTVGTSATLLAVGTAADSIRFDEHWLWPGNGWHGIRFVGASGNSNLSYCRLRHGFAWGATTLDKGGGAILCTGSSPTIQHCLIDNCTAGGSGGAIFCDANAHPAVHDNSFVNNLAWDYGGAIYVHTAGTLNITNSIFSNNTAQNAGGGVYCGSYSTATIASNTLSGNYAGEYGGGIYCGSSSNFTITSNIILADTAYFFGGGIYCGTGSGGSISGNTINNNYGNGGSGIYCATSSNPSISQNTISNNWGIYGGGLYIGASATPGVINNTITLNTAADDGGGILAVEFSNPKIKSNVISRNHAANGGGLYLDSSYTDTIALNEISLNSATGSGGGLFMIYSDPFMNKNTIAADTAATGGGVYAATSYPTLKNSIAWGSVPQQVTPLSGSNVQVTYSDVGFTTIWPGTGNINQNPMFVQPGNDFHLLFGSPCINTGDPNTYYNDPDGSRADMGCYYFTAFNHLHLYARLTGAPIIIPSEGGGFEYCVVLCNTDNIPREATVWCDVTLPDGSSYGPVLGPLTVTLQPGAVLSRQRTQMVPADAPAGNYRYNVQATMETENASAGFTFAKLGTWGQTPRSEWQNYGEPLEEPAALAGSAAPAIYQLGQNYPNPFNPTTAIGYTLQAANQVSLKVYDTAGRLVATLVDGWRQAGTHEVTFDASNLASGVYLYRLQAGEYTDVKKMMLVK